MNVTLKKKPYRAWNHHHRTYSYPYKKNNHLPCFLQTKPNPPFYRFLCRMYPTVMKREPPSNIGQKLYRQKIHQANHITASTALGRCLFKYPTEGRGKGKWKWKRKQGTWALGRCSGSFLSNLDGIRYLLYPLRALSLRKITLSYIRGSSIWISKCIQIPPL